MSRMAEYAAEHPKPEPVPDFQEDFDRIQREEAAIERCRLLMEELRQLIHELNSHRKPMQ